MLARAQNPETSFQRALNGDTSVKPIWFMRQAGRYLPEYRQVRQHAGGFLDLCYSPKLAAEVTLQPIRRFDFDAAIIFSDILVIPQALGRKVWFEEGEGPRLDKLNLSSDPACQIKDPQESLSAVYEALSMTRQGLGAEKSLIGFAGAPWTLACYMLEGQTSKAYQGAKLQALENPQKFLDLLEVLSETIAQHLIYQIEAGADAVQIFDSWAALVPDAYVDSWIIQPIQKIVERVRAQHPTVPIISFAKDLGQKLPTFAQKTQVNAVGLGFSEDLKAQIQNLPSNVTTQGAIDPMILVAGGDVLRAEIERQKQMFADRPHIFNLGHGIVPQTPPDHVAQAIEWIRA